MLSALGSLRTAAIKGAPTVLPLAAQPARGMATLKEIRNRLKSVRSIAKITKSMKMVSAAKFARQEKNLRIARVFGQGVNAFAEKSDVTKAMNTKGNELLVAVSSDRGLCGAIHSNIAKRVKGILGKTEAADNKLVICGDKAKTILMRTNVKDFAMHFSELGKRPPTFDEATMIAQQILKQNYKFDTGRIVYNYFKSAIAYESKEIPLVPLDALTSDAMASYEVEDDVLQNYQEFLLGASIYYALMEASTSELSARMTAMDNASKNAGEMINKLTLTFNRTRQAVITGELIEILSGAAALD